MNRLIATLDLTLPLLQAGMGGLAGPQLAAAVSAAGAGGVLALYKETPEGIRRLIAATTAATTRPFGVNLIPEIVGPATARAQVLTALEFLPPSSFVTFFGLPDGATAAEVIQARRRIVIEVGTARDAEAALDLGADVLVLQGVEAGGHLLGTIPAATLLQKIRARHPSAVLAIAGSIATGIDLARALSYGADGGMAGTLFVPTRESAAHPLFKHRVLAAAACDTVVTSLFEIGWPARPHRVLRNALTESSERQPATFIATTTVDGQRLPVPRYSATTPSIRTEGRVEEMAMYCGNSCERVTEAQSVASVLTRFRHEFEVALARLEVI
ncbi:MAG TPA: nitronate monooxygenase [Pseudonocardiaceae bacterium]|nr:nitronate monooxygenase [Pseudonocardiaceae bacterium]